MKCGEIERGNPQGEYAVAVMSERLGTVDPAGRVAGASRHCPLRHLRDPAGRALGAFLDGLRDASALRLSDCPCCNGPRYRWAQWTRLVIAAMGLHMLKLPSLYLIERASPKFYPTSAYRYRSWREKILGGAWGRRPNYNNNITRKRYSVGARLSGRTQL